MLDRPGLSPAFDDRAGAIVASGDGCLHCTAALASKEGECVEDKTSIAIATAVLTLGTILLAEIRGPSSTSPRFIGLGDLPGGFSYSVAEGVSGDGAVAVGYSHSDAGMEAFRWTLDGGMAGLKMERAFAVSVDGSVVVGVSAPERSAEPVRWTIRGRIEDLRLSSDERNGVACGASADGSTVVGVIDTQPPSFDRSRRGSDTAFLWNLGRGIALLKIPTDEASTSDACAVSADGYVVVVQAGTKSGTIWRSVGRRRPGW